MPWFSVDGAIKSRWNRRQLPQNLILVRAARTVEEATPIRLGCGTASAFAFSYALAAQYFKPICLIWQPFAGGLITARQRCKRQYEGVSHDDLRQLP
jgi:hypothetical protein